MTATPTARPAETLRLLDGRLLSYAEFGDLTGTPVFFFHGGADSRLTRPDDRITADLRVHLITADRPGIGLSSFQPKRRFLDWPKDVTSLADALGLDRFGVLGWSLGGPHALACAYAIPGRLTTVGVVSGLAPLDGPGALSTLNPFHRRLFRLSRVSRRLVQPPLVLRKRRALRDFEAYMAATFAAIGDADRDVYALPGVREMKSEGFRELLKGPSRGLAHEIGMAAHRWDFKLSEIDLEVLLWYGTADRTTPLWMAHYFEDALPKSKLTVFPGEGHQMVFKRWREILGAFV